MSIAETSRHLISIPSVKDSIWLNKVCPKASRHQNKHVLNNATKSHHGPWLCSGIKKELLSEALYLNLDPCWKDGGTSKCVDHAVTGVIPVFWLISIFDRTFLFSSDNRSLR
jgi:hypothetical protein